MATTVELERLMVRLVGDASQYHRMLSQAGLSTEAFARNVDRLSSIVLARLSLELVRVGQTAVKSFADFDKAMTEATSIMDNLDISKMEKMRDTALELSTMSSIGPTELAKGYYELASAGFEAEQAITALKPVMDFAIAGNFDLAKATRYSVGSLQAMGQASEDAEVNMSRLVHLTDVLVKASAVSLATTEQLAISMTSGAASSSRIYGKSLEETTAVLAAFADQNIKAELAGHAFQRILYLLSNAQRDRPEAFKFFGFDIFDETGKMRHMADILEDIERITKRMSHQARGAFLEAVGFEARIQGAITPLIGKSGRIREHEKAITVDIDGTTAGIAAKQMQAFSNQVKMLYNQITVFVIQMVRTVIPAITEFMKIVSGIVGWMRSWSDETKRTVAILVALAGSLLPTLLIMRLMVAMSGLFIPLIGVFATLISMFGRMILLVTLIKLGIWGVVGAFTALKTVIVAFTSFVAFVAFIKAIVVSIATVVAFIVPFTVGLALILGGLLALAAVTTRWVKSVGGVSNAWEEVKKNAVAAWEWLKPIRQALESLVIAIGDKLVAAWASVEDKVAEVFHNISGGAEVNWNEIRDIIRDSLLFIEWGMSNTEKIWDHLQLAFHYGWERIGNDIKHLFTVVIPKSWEWFKENFINLMAILGKAMYITFHKTMFAIVDLIVNIPWYEIFSKLNVAVGRVVNEVLGTFWNFQGNLMLWYAEGRKKAIMGPDKGVQEANKKAIEDWKKNEFGNISPEIKKALEEFNGLPKLEIAGRVVGDKEADLLKQLKESTNKVMNDFKPWHENKLFEFWLQEWEEGLHAFDMFENTDMEKFPMAIEEMGEETGLGFVKGIEKGLSQLDNVLVGSAEDFRRMQKYMFDLANPANQLAKIQLAKEAQEREHQRRMKNYRNLELRDKNIDRMIMESRNVDILRREDEQALQKLQHRANKSMSTIIQQEGWIPLSTDKEFFKQEWMDPFKNMRNDDRLDNPIQREMNKALQEKRQYEQLELKPRQRQAPDIIDRQGDIVTKLEEIKLVLMANNRKPSILLHDANVI